MFFGIAVVLGRNMGDSDRKHTTKRLCEEHSVKRKIHKLVYGSFDVSILHCEPEQLVQAFWWRGLVISTTLNSGGRLLETKVSFCVFRLWLEWTRDMAAIPSFDLLEFSELFGTSASLSDALVFSRFRKMFFWIWGEPRFFSLGRQNRKCKARFLAGFYRRKCFAETVWNSPSLSDCL